MKNINGLISEEDVSTKETSEEKLFMRGIDNG